MRVAREGTYDWCVRWMRWAPFAAVCGSLLVMSSGAVARIIAPPGHSGTSQYVEVIPSSAGNAAPPGTVRGSGSASAGPQALANLGHGSSADARLAKLGKEGQAAAALAASTAPTPVSGGTNGSGSAAAKRVASQGSSAAGGITAALSSAESGGMGILLPLLLATALIAAVGVIAARLAGRPGIRSP